MPKTKREINHPMRRKKFWYEDKIMSKPFFHVSQKRWDIIFPPHEPMTLRRYIKKQKGNPEFYKAYQEVLEEEA